GLEALVGGGAGPERRLGRLGGVDHEVVAVGGQEVVRREVAVEEGCAAGVQGGDEPGGVGRQGLVPLRGGGRDQGLVVEERAAEGGVEEVVVEGVLLGQLALGEVGGVDVAEDQAAVVAPGDELVVGAAVDLLLFGVEAVDHITGEAGGGGGGGGCVGGRGGGVEGGG